MKIGILTQPLHTNYGGLLQAYALQQILIKEFGANPKTINIQMNVTFKTKLKGYIKNFAKKYILFQKNVNIFSFRPTENQRKIIAKHSDNFIENNISVTEKILRYDIKSLKKYNFDAYIVGSDQVWRPKYSPNIFTYFLEFLKDNNAVKKLSYAASFGVDRWEYSISQSQKCSELAKKFNAISVREDAAIDLCKRNLGVTAEKVLDPTLLLDAEAYKEIIDESKTKRDEEDFVMFYVLDPNLLKGALVAEIRKKLNFSFFQIMPKPFTKENVRNIDDCVYPPVSSWLEGFYKAKYVVTDSFHGTAFSILFNKQFIALGNVQRGMSRFKSILKMFGLEDRLVTNLKQIENGILDKNIDFESVNNILKNERNKSINFLRKNLFK
ncbi:polysaccharide pyruvyl transferase family protein [Cyclobacterium sp. 1_MG-2023]|uniref:polysaccharide pyruvyl transferase family protein n=1 Tax=Cyclobacterium sp. 1_MG-2023 TaxID=3062681 RepID=UPI0026E2A2F3|nr:polysaccharide pyruvyl transferase family protein [Cyclobacterium sp. 1_MG-2023]MDO6440387.1 polysaccharide pyruvyl transferase family protein [Cyclobacterium sp. 1_MG-2023]